MEAAIAVERRRAEHLMLTTEQSRDGRNSAKTAPVHGGFYQRPVRAFTRLFSSFSRSRHRRNRAIEPPVVRKHTEPLVEIVRESAPAGTPFTWSTPSQCPRSIAPCARSGHVAVLVGNVYLYVYGGYARGGVHGVRFPEMWRYHLLTEVWEKVHALGGQPPVATCSQSAVLFKDSILFFGGTTVPFGTVNANDVTMFSLTTSTWTTVDIVGDPPSPRFGQAVALDAAKENLWVIGGTDGHSFFNDVWRLDLQSWTWECCEIGAPEQELDPRMMLQILRMQNQEEFDNNINMEDDDDDSDEEMGIPDGVQHEPGAEGRDAVGNAEGGVLIPANAPCGRYRHEMIMLPQGRIAVIGGGWPFPVTGARIDAITLYDTHTRQWLRQPCRSAAPAKEIPLSRRSHTCTLIGQNVYMLGGTDGNSVFPWEHVWMLDTRTFVWHKLPNPWPIPSYFHVTVATDEGYLVTFGGVDVKGTGDGERHNKVCCLPTRIPSLHELALQAVVTRFGNNADVLMECGVPHMALGRMLVLGDA
eukprot:m.1637554 g.1637554  ORF g.1637554 m.1637554 type:complete len:528 (-) comp25943_c0_seq1:379-1962(-)